MIRRVVVQQDEVVTLRNGGELGIVSQNALAQELLTWAAILDRMGGHLRVTTHRQRNPDVDGEAFTVGAMVEWVDRTDDARVAPEQELSPPAQRVAPPSPIEPVFEPDEPVFEPDEAEGFTPEPSQPPDADDPQAAAARAAYEADGDGIVVGPDGEPEEDLTSIPAELR